MLNPECPRGYDFIDRFVRDYTALEGLGYGRADILRMLGTQQYVQDFCDTPEWIDTVPRLPKGLKWADGRKYTRRAGRRQDGESYTFLSAGNELYIRNLLDNMGFYGYRDADGKVRTKNDADMTRELTWYHMRDKTICVIHGWKTLPANAVVQGLDAVMTPFLESAILEIWHGNNITLGWRGKHERESGKQS